MLKPRIKEDWMLYRNANAAAKSAKLNFIPSQWQKAMKEGWEIRETIILEVNSTYFEWYKPSENGMSELVGPVSGTNLEEFGFLKPTFESLREEARFLSHLSRDVGDIGNKDLLIKQGTLVSSLILGFSIIFSFSIFT
jgi:hypothetical protein